MKKNKALEGILQNSGVRNARFLLICKLVKLFNEPFKWVSRGNLISDILWTYSTSWDKLDLLLFSPLWLPHQASCPLLPGPRKKGGFAASISSLTLGPLIIVVGLYGCWEGVWCSFLLFLESANPCFLLVIALQTSLPP